jgi:hypothetical protein
VAMSSYPNETRNAVACLRPHLFNRPCVGFWSRVVSTVRGIPGLDRRLVRRARRIGAAPELVRACPVLLAMEDEAFQAMPSSHLRCQLDR